jgi:hypothetical protein
MLDMGQDANLRSRRITIRRFESADEADRHELDYWA